MTIDFPVNNLKRDEFGRPSGIAAVNKPAGVTSHDLVDKIRKQLGTKKVGHAGALDVFADGVMIYLIGKSTKLSDKLMHLDKEYITTIVLGIATDTQDTEGKITEIKTGYQISEIVNVDKILSEFVGEHIQYVSTYSSVKVDGQKLRLLMRNDAYEKQLSFNENNQKILVMTPKEEFPDLKEKIVKIPAKTITIYEIELLEMGDMKISDMVTFSSKLLNLPTSQTFPFLKIRVRSSKGTYIRQLAEDIGDKLTMPAMLLNLTRTKVGEIKLADCLKVEEVT